MTIKQFLKQFPDEESCIKHFKNYRDRVGVVCNRCTGTDHYWLSTRLQYKCKNCNSRQSLRSGTVLERTKLPFYHWYFAMMLLTGTKKSFSALEVQRQLEHKFYEPIWYMMHKIRRVMGQRDSEYQLQGHIELDEAFFVSTPPLKDEDGNKIPKERMRPGHGSPRSATVLVMVGSTPNPKQTNPHRPKSAVSYLKMIQIPDHKGGTIIPEVVKHTDVNNLSVTTDKGRHYSKLKNVVKQHIPYNTTTIQGHKVLPWVHTTISNAKRLLLDVHHNVGRNYVQNYLNEFCFKFNRRFNDIDVFGRLLNTAIQYRWDT